MRKILSFILLVVVVLTTTTLANSGDLIQGGSYIVKIGNNDINSKYPTYVINDRVYIPLRSFCDTLGIPIGWDDEKKEASVDIYNKKVRVSSDTKLFEGGVIPDEETALAVGKIILERYAGLPMEYETEDKIFYLKVHFDLETNTWRISQWFDFKNGGGWAASGVILPCVYINKNTGEVMYINTYSIF